MNKVWDLCKVLENEHRRALLAEIYKSPEGGCNVGYLVDKLRGKIEAPAVTQYLKQLEQLGLLRRERCGKYVNYSDDMSEASSRVRDIALMIREEMRTAGAYDDHGMFRALMNAFRAKVCRYLLHGGSGEKSAICDKFQHFSKYLARDLQPAVACGLLTEYEDSYELSLPSDPIVRRIIELAA